MPPKDDDWPRPLTKEEGQTIELVLAVYSADGKMSLEKLAEEIGYSPGVLSAVFNGSYARDGGRTDRVAKRMKQWLDRVRSDDLAIKRPSFMDLSVAVKIFELCTECRNGRDIGYICGKKGVGKTMAVEAYAEAHRVSTVLITCFKGYTSHALLAEIARRFGVAWKGSVPQMFPRMVSELRRTGHPLLIIDDCDFLGTAIHTARQLHDQADIGVVLSGTTAFLEWMRDHNSGTIGQAHSRISLVLAIDKISYEDGERLADFYGMASAALRKAWDASGRNARELVKICRRARRFAGDGEVEAAHVDDALKSLLPAEL